MGNSFLDFYRLGWVSSRSPVFCDYARGTTLEVAVPVRRTIVILMIAASVAPLAAVPTAADEAQAGTVAVQRVDNLPDTRLRDEAAMVLIGTILIGLAAALRRVS